MKAIWLLIPILIPILGGLATRFINKNDKLRKIVSFSIVLFTSIITIIFSFFISKDSFTLIPFTDSIRFSLKLDGLGKIFTWMISILWPLSTLYSFEYMENEERKNIYNSYYIMTFGIVLGIAFSSNLLTMYVFYEALTFITLPLIQHTMTKEAKRAGRYYLYFSLSGSSMALIGLIVLLVSSSSLEFTFGGIASAPLLEAYLLCFLGFGVKAALFPVCFWLPMAGCAPTPTTALLHAVAVVKAGAFAVMRITYYNFSYLLIKGSWVQELYICLASFTILYGSCMALKEQHFKRRLAYSTISNLSYIVLGTVLMSEFSFNASVLHILYHSITKILLFFACGFIIKNTSSHQLYVYELNGLGKKMPLLFILFTIGSLSLTGIPLFCGFVSKWNLCMACIEENTIFSYIGLTSLLISALLTAIYSLSISIRAFAYPSSNLNIEKFNNAKDANWKVVLILSVFAISTIIFGITSSPIINIISSLLGGVS